MSGAVRTQWRPVFAVFGLGIFMMTRRKKQRLLKQLGRLERIAAWGCIVSPFLFFGLATSVPQSIGFAVLPLLACVFAVPFVFYKISKWVERRMDEVRNEPENWRRHLWRSDYDRDIKELAEAEMDRFESQLESPDTIRYGLKAPRPP
jgi:hypothetical protein